MSHQCFWSIYPAVKDVIVHTCQSFNLPRTFTYSMIEKRIPIHSTTNMSMELSKTLQSYANRIKITCFENHFQSLPINSCHTYTETHGGVAPLCLIDFILTESFSSSNPCQVFGRPLLWACPRSITEDSNLSHLWIRTTHRSTGKSSLCHAKSKGRFSPP